MTTFAEGRWRCRGRLEEDSGIDAVLDPVVLDAQQVTNLKSGQFSDAPTASYRSAEARHPRAGPRPPAKPSSSESWSLRRPRSRRFPLTQLCVLGVHSESCGVEDRFCFRFQLFSHYFISIY